jgi:DNA-binding MarR family transcriptional regulator
MWRDVELRELRIFLALAGELHFGRTAERLGISQPAVSEAVRSLESRLGVKVFDRTSRRVRLTPAGEALKHSLAPALAAVDQALADTSDLSRAVRGLLRVGFVLTTEGPALSQLIAAFQARYPACEVHQPRKPAHPRPQRNRQLHDHGTQHRTCCPAPRHDCLKLRTQVTILDNRGMRGKDRQRAGCERPPVKRLRGGPCDTGRRPFR